ncbi:hypothetical protein D9M72_473720 [compost metagenome]
MQGQFIRKPHVVQRIELQGRTQKVGKRHHHAGRGNGLPFLDQPGDGVQRIEQEMRIDLVSQRAHLRGQCFLARDRQSPFALTQLEAVEQRDEEERPPDEGRHAVDERVTGIRPVDRDRVGTHE